ncbi:hypothetical protein KC19_2G134800 [Ceratodon purpureus]|uniref:Uncharacterized protein n=1 Tax=Ceratodon purpureus TaxID=3225 RepID=A0A8T0IWI3_CERPU|nr:hypothetical protein KC19_2G134800 [Ceratodon purpureus]
MISMAKPKATEIPTWLEAVPFREQALSAVPCIRKPHASRNSWTWAGTTSLTKLSVALAKPPWAWPSKNGSADAPEFSSMSTISTTFPSSCSLFFPLVLSLVFSLIFFLIFSLVSSLIFSSFSSTFSFTASCSSVNFCTSTFVTRISLSFTRSSLASMRSMSSKLISASLSLPSSPKTSASIMR